LDITQIKQVLDAPKKTVTDVLSVGAVPIRKGQTFSVTGTCWSDSRGNRYDYQVLRRASADSDDVYPAFADGKDRDKHTSSPPQWCHPFGEAHEDCWVLVYYPRGEMVLGEDFVQTRVLAEKPAAKPPKVDDYTLYKRYFHPTGEYFDFKFEIYVTDGKVLPPQAAVTKD
jgi:hypothetical protein